MVLKIPPKRIGSDDCAVFVGRVIKLGVVVEPGEAYHVHKGEWVEIVTVSSMEEYISYTSLLGSDYAALAKGGTGVSAELQKAGHDVNRAFSMMCERIAARTIDWNWTDMEGNPLPKPYNNPEVIRRLTVDEVVYLMELTAGTETGDERKNDSGASPATSSAEALNLVKEL